ncbi:MAG: hypothetical protein ACRYF5_17365 [Janthinobacterium lividum]
MDKTLLNRRTQEALSQAISGKAAAMFKHDFSGMLDDTMQLRLQLGGLCERHAFDILGAKAVTYARAALDFMNAGNNICLKIVSGRLAALENEKTVRRAIERRQLVKTADMARSAAISYRLACHELGWLREEIEVQAVRLADIADGEEAQAAWLSMIDEGVEKLANASNALHGLPTELASLPWRPSGRLRSASVRR